MRHARRGPTADTALQGNVPDVKLPTFVICRVALSGIKHPEDIVQIDRNGTAHTV